MASFEPAPGQTPPPDSVHPLESSPDAPTSVSRLNETIRGFISGWGSVWVEGEITAWNLRGGHVFGRLKDASGDAMISFRLWSSTLQRLPADMRDLKLGDRVVACVKSDYFVKSGDFTFTVSAMRHTGLGDQLERLERLQGRVTRRREVGDESLRLGIVHAVGRPDHSHGPDGTAHAPRVSAPPSAAAGRLGANTARPGAPGPSKG